MTATDFADKWLSHAETAVRAAARALGVDVSIVLAAACALVLAAGFAVRRRARARTRCRWKRGGFRHGTNLRHWICADCGVDAYTTTDRVPKECKRALRPVGL
ncbi:MAG: hypothetical protein QM699_08400 [Amaricoccus sp.]|uniref:hypothetical protein n=1 Tax=Amaricoccus sp. TaxID=1872485 RepID=UPI0039E5495A